MVGSGFYLSPAALAPYGLLGPLSWIVMGIGAICLGLSFARLARILPVTGGPYAYTRAAFGDFTGFLIAWGYWISIWCSLPAIAVAFSGYLVDFVPALRGNRAAFVAVTLGVMWLAAFINLRGVHSAGVFAEITTYTKLVPIVIVAFVGLFYADFGNFSEFNPSGQSLLTASGALAPLTMFAYLGLESATVPAGDVRDPERTIPRSTVLGIGMAAIIYLLGTVAVMGVLPRETLIASYAPFADAATAMWGSWAGTVIGLAVMISSIGALNGWTLMMGQVPMAAAKDGLFPAAFGRLSSRGVPAFGIVLSVGLASVLLLIQASGGARPLLQRDRESQHDGCGHPLRLLRGRRGDPRAPRGRSDRRLADRRDRVRVLGLYRLGLRTRGGSVRAAAAPARHPHLHPESPRATAAHGHRRLRRARCRNSESTQKSGSCARSWSVGPASRTSA